MLKTGKDEFLFSILLFSFLKNFIVYESQLSGLGGSSVPSGK